MEKRAIYRLTRNVVALILIAISQDAVPCLGSTNRGGYEYDASSGLAPKETPDSFKYISRSRDQRGEWGKGAVNSIDNTKYAQQKGYFGGQSVILSDVVAGMEPLRSEDLDAVLAGHEQRVHVFEPVELGLIDFRQRRFVVWRQLNRLVRESRVEVLQITFTLQMRLFLND